MDTTKPDSLHMLMTLPPDHQPPTERELLKRRRIRAASRRAQRRLEMTWPQYLRAVDAE